MKKAFIVVTFVLGVALVAMLLTKPEPKEHYEVPRNWRSWALKASMLQHWRSLALMWI